MLRWLVPYFCKNRTLHSVNCSHDRYLGSKGTISCRTPSLKEAETSSLSLPSRAGRVVLGPRSGDGGSMIPGALGGWCSTLRAPPI